MLFSVIITLVFLAILFGSVFVSEYFSNEAIKKIAESIDDRNMIEQRKLNEMIEQNKWRRSKIPPAPRPQNLEDASL